MQILLTFLLLSLGQLALATSINEHYSNLVLQSYQDAYNQAKILQKDISAFLTKPNADTLAQARLSWINARKAYLPTEAFRFYEGPIDFENAASGESGPEGRLNAWPLNEGFIDSVAGKPQSGLIHQLDISMTLENILQNDQVSDEADVTTGFHAIEFMLWGQDFSDVAPGNRDAAAFAGENIIAERRREYLRLVTQLLVDDLAGLVAAWQPNQDNYRQSFHSLSEKEAVSKILTALATLSAFEMASERLAVALDSGDQEDEHSCFSDTTHQDFVYNQLGIANVFFGSSATYNGVSLAAWLRGQLQGHPDAAKLQPLVKQLHQTQALTLSLAQPFDSILRSEIGSPERATAEALIVSLQKQGQLFQEIGQSLGLDVVILSE